MAGEWRISTLGEVADVTKLAGFEFTKHVQYVPNGEIIALRALNLKDGMLNLENVKRISKRSSDSLPRSKLYKNDILFSYTGTIGEVALVDEDDRYHLAPNICRLRTKGSIEPRFVFYYLRSAAFKEILRGYVVGSTQSTIPMMNIRQIEIPIPPVIEQRAIAQILCTLDDKIELNQKMNETLEAMARALFKSWFVDFDPVRAKAEGRDPGLPKPLADLFPDSFEDSELGEIPKGWEVKGLDEIARFLNGLALQKFPPKDGRSLPVIKIAQLRAGNTDGADSASADLEMDYVVEDGDVLFSWSGSLECVLWAGARGALNQHLFKVTSTEYPKWLYYLWIHQHLANFRHIAAAKATTMGHIQRHHLSGAKVVLPSAALLRAAGRHFNPLIETIPQRLVQSRSLAAARDALLPKLISGEVRVANADRILDGTS